MRTFAVLFSILLFSALTFGQENFDHSWRGIAGYCPYGCAPYIPLLTTPSLSFATVSPNPTGATDATGGLVAGATDSTLSEVSRGTSAVFTMPVWYSGGQTPLMSPLLPESARMRPFAGGRSTQGGPAQGRWVRPQQNSSPLAAFRPEQPAQAQQANRQAWIYLSSAEPTGEQPTVAPGQKAVKTLSNADVDRLNQENGTVKYDSKTEKIQ
jgi:hypothetical protein